MQNQNTPIQWSIEIDADGKMPGSKHTRSFTAESSSLDIHENNFRYTIPIQENWSTPEPVRGGPEKALWDNFYGPKVLHRKKYPEVCVEGQFERGSQTLRISAEILLRGTSQPIEIELSNSGTAYEGDVALDLRRWGFPKFSALMGLMWVEPEVKLRLKVSSTIFD